MSKHRSLTHEFKAQVVLEALSGAKSVGEDGSKTTKRELPRLIEVIDQAGQTIAGNF